MTSFSPEEDAPPRTLAERTDDLLLWLDNYRSHRQTGVIAACLIIALIAGAWWSSRPSDAAAIEELIPQVTLGLAPGGLSGDVTGEPLLVHVVGAVLNPGVVELPEASRVLDAITAAGGPTKDADLQQLNLAALLSDGVQIRVPVEGEALSGEVLGSLVAGTDAQTSLVNINLASLSELERLPGVGPATAAAIVAYRDDAGTFNTVEELLGVPGIGPAKLERLRDQATVR